MGRLFWIVWTLNAIMYPDERETEGGFKEKAV